MKPYYVYLLRCGDGSLYAGITTDPDRRLRQHQGLCPGGAKYTALRGAEGFAALWSASDRAAASRLEYRLKKLSRAQKLLWIGGEADEALRTEGFLRQTI